VFGSLIGDRKLLFRALITLAIGVAITTLLSTGLGLIARGNGLLIVDSFPEEITARLEPTLLDLGIALAAGAIATYAKVNPGAVSSMAGTAIAVALVPPVCVMGIMLAAGELDQAQGAGLLFSANLLGILIGGIIVLATREPYFREKLRTQNRSRLPLLIALILAFAVGEKLYGRYQRHLYTVKRENAKERIESGIRAYLKQRTATFGNNESLELASVSFDWPDYWERQRSPQLQVVVRVTDPTTPSYKQVQLIQDRINEKIKIAFPGLKLQMQVQRINVTIVSGKDVILESEEFNLERILRQDIPQNSSLPEAENAIKAEPKASETLIE
jgi:ABC-type multidrug transport system fused ATPase/permease subunit